MNDNWTRISSEIGLYTTIEGNVHPHVPIEIAHLYHCHDNCSTEWEFLNLINAFVIATKPKLAIETGTYWGYAAMAIASAMRANGIGKLITLDIVESVGAKQLSDRFGFNDIIEFRTEDAFQFINQWNGDRFDFAFIDSGLTRTQECQALVAGKASPDAIIIHHDASPYRAGTTSNELIVNYLKTVPCSLKIWKSRGLQIHQV